ncbi:MAG: O-antigen ligase family protein [Bacteroidales bacterium]
MIIAKSTRLQILWIGILIIILPIICSNSTLDPDLYIRFIGLSIYLIILTIYVIININNYKILSDPKILLVYLLFVIYTFFCIFITRNITDGIFEWIKILYGFILLFLLSGLIKNIKLELDIVKSFTLLCFILSISGAIDLFKIILHGKLIIPLSTYQVTSFYGHRNLYCQMLFFSFPFTLISSLYIKKRFWKITGFSSFVISLFLLIILSNRATWIVLIAGFLSLIIFYLIHYSGNLHFHYKNISSGKKILFLVTVFVLIFVFIIYRNYTNVTSLQTHAKDIVDFNKGSTKDRLELWTRTIQMIKEKPLFGQGLGNWKIEILKYGNKGLVSEDHNTFYQRPHNDFLWIMSECGLTGILLFATIWIITIVYIVQILFKCKSNEEFFFYNMLFFVILGYLIFSFFSFPRERAETIIVTSFILGLTMNKHNEIRGKKYANPRLIKLFLYLILILISASLYIIYSRYLSDIHMKNALIAKENKNYTAIIKEINKANSIFYPTDPFSTPLSWYRGSAFFNLNKTDMALKDFEEAYQISPYHIHVLNNLASCYELKGEHDNSIRFYKKALTIAPNFEEAWLNLCAVYFNLGQTDSAYQALTNIDTKTKNPKYKKFLTVVMKSEFGNIAKTNPSLQKWYKLFNKEPDKYFKIHQIRLTINKNISIFTDTLLLKSIFTFKTDTL